MNKLQDHIEKVVQEQYIAGRNYKEFEKIYTKFLTKVCSNYEKRLFVIKNVSYEFIYAYANYRVKQYKNDKKLMNEVDNDPDYDLDSMYDDSEYESDSEYNEKAYKIRTIEDDEDDEDDEYETEDTSENLDEEYLNIEDFDDYFTRVTNRYKYDRLHKHTNRYAVFAVHHY